MTFIVCSFPLRLLRGGGVNGRELGVVVGHLRDERVVAQEADQVGADVHGGVGVAVQRPAALAVRTQSQSPNLVRAPARVVAGAVGLDGGVPADLPACDNY